MNSQGLPTTETKQRESLVNDPNLYAAQTINRSHEAMCVILTMHVPLDTPCLDVTWGGGGFWTETARAFYNPVKCDMNLRPNVPLDVISDFRALPFRPGSFGCVTLDPPWGCLSTAPRRDRIKSTYTLTPLNGPKGLLDLYRQGITEAAEVLRPGGILVVKCQDQVNSGRKHWFSVEVHHMLQTDFMVIDRALQINKRPPPQPAGRKQRHLRENLSTYWIAKRKEHGKP